MADAPHFPAEEAARVVERALEEDLGGLDGVDVTTEATIDPGAVADAVVVARAAGVVAGLPIIEMVLTAVTEITQGGAVTIELTTADGARVDPGTVLARLRGPVATILTGERTLLNILSRVSGVATATGRWTAALDGTGVTVLDTRKTTPGLRALEKYAVRAGGGTNKRMGLFDVAMIKDNHKLAAGSVTAAYERVRERFPDVSIEVEVTTLAEAQEAIAAGARFIMCDNMTPAELAETVAAVRGGDEDVEIEATGGLTLETVAAYAATGVDYLSVGGLTHSAPILDIALDLAEDAAAG